MLRRPTSSVQQQLSSTIWHLLSVTAELALATNVAVASPSSTNSQQHHVWQLPAACITVTNSSLAETQAEEVD